MYPRFYSHHGDLVAILKPDRVFHLKTATFGKGAGFEFRVYITRKMALKYDSGHRISFDEFRQKLFFIMGEYLKEVSDLLPKELLIASNNQKLLQ